MSTVVLSHYWNRLSTTHVYLIGAPQRLEDGGLQRRRRHLGGRRKMVEVRRHAVSRVVGYDAGGRILTYHAPTAPTEDATSFARVATRSDPDAPARARCCARPPTSTRQNIRGDRLLVAHEAPSHSFLPRRAPSLSHLGDVRQHRAAGTDVALAAAVVSVAAGERDEVDARNARRASRATAARLDAQ